MNDRIIFYRFRYNNNATLEAIIFVSVSLPQCSGICNCSSLQIRHRRLAYGCDCLGHTMGYRRLLDRS